MAAGDRAVRVGQIRTAGRASWRGPSTASTRTGRSRSAVTSSPTSRTAPPPIAILQAGHEALLDGVTEPTPAELSSLRYEVLRLARMVGDLQTLAAADAAVLNLARRRATWPTSLQARPTVWPEIERLASRWTGS